MAEAEDRFGESIKDEWQLETYQYNFGHVAPPSESTYRINGERIQLRIEQELLLFSGNVPGQFTAGADQVMDFWAIYQDCYLSVHDSHEVTGEERSRPSLWLVGTS